MMPAALWPLESWIRRWQTQVEPTAAASRALRAAMMLPAFSVLWAALRLRARSIGPVETRARAIDDSLFICHLPDLVQTYIHLFGIWEPDLTHFVRRRLSKGDAFVDVGANIGYYTVLASKWVGRRGRVVAIEASPRVFADLSVNVMLNRTYDNVRMVNMAATASVGEVEVFAGPRHNIGLTTTVAGRGMPVQARVQGGPLGELMSDSEVRAARLVKIDVEGGEADVLDGMKSFLDRCRDDVEILVEMSPHWWADRSRKPSEVLAPLFDRGFKPFSMPNSYWPWRYLWPNRVTPPRRIEVAQVDRARRLDLVLSRQDTAEL